MSHVYIYIYACTFKSHHIQSYHIISYHIYMSISNKTSGFTHPLVDCIPSLQSHQLSPPSPGALVATALLTAVLVLGQENKKWQQLRQKARFAGDLLMVHWLILVHSNGCILMVIMIRHWLMIIGYILMVDGRKMVSDMVKSVTIMMKTLQW